MVTSAAAPAAGGAARQATGTGDPVLASKITVPGVPGWLVPRPRLDKLIAQGAEGPMTIVTGPPGAGKTMALALWAAASPPGGPLAWVTIDDYDNRPRVFWSYVVAALRRGGVSIPERHVRDRAAVRGRPRVPAALRVADGGAGSPGDAGSR